jgi:hypothetical protein
MIKHVREVIRRNKLFAGALTAGAVLRLLAVLGYPGALWFYGDSYIYLGAALRPQPNASKTTGYSLFLRALLPLHSLTLVVVLQHLMGLADAVMIYALLRRARVSKKWATIASLPMLLDGYVIENEHLIMTEALFTFLLMAGMTIVLWRPRTSWWKALIAGLLLGFAAIVRTEGAVVLIIFPLFLLVRGWSWKTAGGWVAAVVMCVGILVPVGGYASWFHSRHGQYELTRSTGLYLWGRVSSFADCARIKPTGAQATVCPTQALRDRMPPGNYIWHAPQVQKIPGGAVSPHNNSLLTSFAIHAVVRLPADRLPEVRHDVLLQLPRALQDGDVRHAPPGPERHGQEFVDPRRHRLRRLDELRPPAARRGGQGLRLPPDCLHPRLLHMGSPARCDLPARPRRRDRRTAAGPDGADVGRAATAAALAGPGNQHAAVDHRRGAAGHPDRGRRLRLPVPDSGPPVRLCCRWPGLRPGGPPGPP